MKNQTRQGTPTSPRFCICPTTVKSGDFVLIGDEPACALNDYQASEGGAARALVEVNVMPTGPTPAGEGWL